MYVPGAVQTALRFFYVLRDPEICDEVLTLRTKKKCKPRTVNCSLSSRQKKKVKPFLLDSV
jgi:hypothetical protein